MGCYVQEAGDRILEFEGVNMVLGNVTKYNILDYISQIENGQSIADVKTINEIDWSSSSYSTFFEDSIISDSRRTRANLKVQEGCDYYCSYCIIPYLRGPSRSRDYKSCIQEALDLQARGYKEIVLTGINIGTYNYKDKNLVDLIQGLLETTDLRRIRISSIEPDLVSEALIDLIGDEKRLCRHLHIPLQHGANKILKRMNRRYTVEDYSELVRKVKARMPDICLGTDIMTGFPGETVQDYREMYNNLKKLPVWHYHVFRYSAKKGTRAYELSDKVNSKKIKERAQKLRQLGHKKKVQVLENYPGKKVEVLGEQLDNKNYVTGYTDNFIRVKFKGKEQDVNNIRAVSVKSVNNETLLGELGDE